MKISLHKIAITLPDYYSIREEWHKRAKTEQNDIHDILDEVRTMKFDLRVPVKLKNSEGYMVIPSEIIGILKPDMVILEIHCNLLKPLIIALLMAPIISLILFFFHMNGVLFFVLIPLIASIHFAILYFRISRLSKEFLRTVKNTYGK